LRHDFEFRPIFPSLHRLCLCVGSHINATLARCLPIWQHWQCQTPPANTLCV
jgi:hypothetical protein